MTSLDAVTAWIGNYERAWTSNDPAEIGELFAEDAAYFPEPWATPWRGRAEIVSKWLARLDEPGSWTFSWHPLIVTDDVAIIQGETVYPDRRYSNLWVLRLDSAGQARQFTEWWMDQSESS
ncbi:nuclear transport factor 2 family protein [Actinoplanes sp. NPDC051633]|uniref:YybH family protein n=1 Tax=Actinoplanes sp. NPDC051633 TaxID=3155670 RepID=UPI0034220EC0